MPVKDKANLSAMADQARLAAIVDSSDDAIISKTLDGIITTWNAGAERIFGYSAAEAIGQHISLIIPEDRLDEETHIISMIKQGRRINHFETVRQKKNGEFIDISLTISPIKDASGALVGASKIARDITEQKRVRNALEKANADLEQFAFVASHDLQEPLRNIVSQIQLFAEEVPLPPEAEPYITQIVSSAARMRELIKDMFSYVELAADQDAARETVDLNDVIGEVKANLKAVISSNGAEISCDPLPKVMGRSRHFQSLFQNLISNAIKYRGAEPPRINISCRTDGDGLEISVSDNGMGIDPQYFKKIFVPFKRLHGRSIPGSGVGLAICQRVCERYGGTIRVSSEPGKGSQFCVSLPESILAKAA